MTATHAPTTLAESAYGLPLDNDAAVLSLVTRKLFHAGFNRAAVDGRWPAFERVFHGFDPPTLAGLGGEEEETIAREPGIIRNRRKIRATLRNARHFVEVAETHGSWRAWLATLRPLPYEQKADTLCACLAGYGPAATFYFLLEAGEATLDDKPDWVR